MQKELDLWITVYLYLHFSRCSPNEWHVQQVWVWVKNFLGSPSKDRPAKKVCTESERLTVSCRVTGAWSERVNLEH
jgi:hypothetical protein